MQEEKKHLPKISVVIPMYNCEEFVHGVLRMFSDQTFDDFEVICVIDGATDGTEEEVKKYCETDDRFRYVVRENGGAGAARNTGLDIAKGEYIVFCDADDVYSLDLLKKMFHAAKECCSELVIAQCSCFDYEIGSYIHVDNYGYNTEKLKPGICYSKDDVDELWTSVGVRITNRLYLRVFLLSHGLRFSETHIANDFFFSFASLSKAERFSVVSDELIEVRRHINKKSLMSNRWRYLHEAAEELEKLYKWLKLNDLIESYFEDYLQVFANECGLDLSYATNTAFISKMASILNTQEPWKEMTSGELIGILPVISRVGVLENNVKTLEKLLSSAEFSSDKALIKEMEKNRNMANSIKLLRQVSKDRYGRDFHTPESLPFATEKNEVTIIRQGSQSYFDNMCLQVNWTITDDCNYRCSYCFFSKSGYKKNYCSLEQAETTLKHIATANRPFYDITLLGGEPSLHPNFPEIINLCTDYLGNRLNKICIITNGNFGERTISSLKEAAQHTGIILIISIHFEFAQIDKLVHIVEELSDKVTISFKVMLHPDIFEKIQNTFNRLCELRKKHKFDLNITLLREPPGFVNIDSRYDDTHLLWIGNARKHF